jgi:hypothetical protein
MMPGAPCYPHHIKTLAERLAEHEVEKNRTSTFMKRKRDVLSSKYFKVEELGRVVANNPRNKKSFYALVSLIQWTERQELGG